MPANKPTANANNIEYRANSKVTGRPIEINSVTDLPGYLNEGPKSPTKIQDK